MEVMDLDETPRAAFVVVFMMFRLLWRFIKQQKIKRVAGTESLMPF